MIVFLVFLSLIVSSSFIYMVLEKDRFTKIMILNYISGIVILIISMLSLSAYRSFYIDIAIIYVVLSFIASLAFSNYFKRTNKKHDNE